MPPQDPDEADERYQPEESGDEAGHERRPVAALADDLPFPQRSSPVLLHSGDERADRVHPVLSEIGQDLFLRGLEACFLPEGDRRAEHVQRSADELSKLWDAQLLPGVARGQPRNRREALVDDSKGLAIRLEVSLVTGQEEAALAGLGVLHRGKKAVERNQHLVRPADEGGVAMQLPRVAERDARVGRDQEGEDREARGQPLVEPRAPQRVQHRGSRIRHYKTTVSPLAGRDVRDNFGPNRISSS